MKCWRKMSDVKFGCATKCSSVPEWRNRAVVKQQNPETDAWSMWRHLWRFSSVIDTFINGNQLHAPAPRTASQPFVKMTVKDWRKHLLHSALLNSTFRLAEVLLVFASQGLQSGVRGEREGLKSVVVFEGAVQPIQPLHWLRFEDRRGQRLWGGESPLVLEAVTKRDEKKTRNSVRDPSMILTFF